MLFNPYFLLEAAPTTRTNASQDIRTEESDGEDDQRERHNQVDKLCDDLTDLEFCGSNLDGERRHTLARRDRGREDGDKDAVIQRLEKTSHHTSEVERRSQNDDVLGIQHLLSGSECFSANDIMRVKSDSLNRLAGKATSLLAFDCEFWHKGSMFLPREVGGYQLTRSGDSWIRSKPFFVVLPPPPSQLNRVSSSYSTVSNTTSEILDILEITEHLAPEFLRNDDSVKAYFADKMVKPHLKPTSWLAEFAENIRDSVVIVKGRMDLNAIKYACSEYNITYHKPIGVVDIATSNPHFTKRCGTAKLDGAYTCISKELDASLKKAFPVGKAHNPVSDAAMTIQIAAWLSEKDMR